MKITKKERQEVDQFFSSQGQKCLKVTLVASHSDGTKDFNCLVLAQDGSHETALLKIKNPLENNPRQAPLGCAL